MAETIDLTKESDDEAPAAPQQPPQRTRDDDEAASLALARRLQAEEDAAAPPPPPRRVDERPAKKPRPDTVGDAELARRLSSGQPPRRSGPQIERVHAAGGVLDPSILSRVDAIVHRKT